MLSENIASPNELKSLQCAGWAQPDDKFYTDTLERGEWTKEVLLIGFKINIKQFVQFDKHILMLIRRENLLTVNFASASGYIGRAGKAITNVVTTFKWLRNPLVPTTWRGKALRGYFIWRIRDIKQKPKVLDSNVRVVRRYLYPSKMHERWEKVQTQDLASKVQVEDAPIS